MVAAFALLPQGEGAPKGRMRATAAHSGKHAAQAHARPALRATFSHREKGYVLELY